MGQPQGQAGSRGSPCIIRPWTLAPRSSFGIFQLPFLPVPRRCRRLTRHMKVAEVLGRMGTACMAMLTAPSHPTDVESICLNTHKYLSPLMQASSSRGAPTAHPAPPSSLGWGDPSRRDGASHMRMQDPGDRVPQPPWSPQPHTEISSGPWGMRGTAPIEGRLRQGIP